MNGEEPPEHPDEADVSSEGQDTPETSADEQRASPDADGGATTEETMSQEPTAEERSESDEESSDENQNEDDGPGGDPAAIAAAVAGPGPGQDSEDGGEDEAEDDGPGGDASAAAAAVAGGPDGPPDDEGSSEELSVDDLREDAGNAASGSEARRTVETEPAESERVDRGPGVVRVPESEARWIEVEEFDVKVSEVEQGLDPVDDSYSIADPIPGVDEAVLTGLENEWGDNYYFCPHCFASLLGEEFAEEHLSGCTGIGPYEIGREARLEQKCRRLVAADRLARDDPRVVKFLGAPKRTRSRYYGSVRLDLDGEFLPARALDAKLATTDEELANLLEKELSRSGDPRKPVIAIINKARSELREDE